MDPTTPRLQPSSAALEARAATVLDVAFRAQGEARIAQSRRALELIADAPKRTGLLRAYELCARTFETDTRGDLEGAFDLGSAAVEALDGDEEMRSCMLLEVGLNSARRGCLDEAGGFFERGLDHARSHAVGWLEARFLSAQALSHAVRGESDRCLEKYHEARRLFRRQDDLRGEATLLAMAGPVYESLGAYPEAMHALIDCIRIAERDPQPDPSVLVTGLATLAGTYVNLGQPREAERLARRALSYEGVPPQSELQARFALTRSLIEAGNEEGALSAGREALEAARRLGEDYFVADALHVLGEVERRAGRLEPAAVHFDEGRALMADMSPMRLQLDLELGRALVLEGGGEFTAAGEAAATLVDAFQEFGWPGKQAEIQELRSRLAEAQRDDASAFEHLKRAHAIRMRSRRSESEGRTRAIQAAHELDGERRQSVGRARELSGLVIQSQEEERKRVASELHDGLGQRLALLSVELDLLARSSADSGEVAADSLTKLAESAQSIAEQVHLISHQLHPAPLAQLGFESATRAICGEVQRVHGLEVLFECTGLPDRLADAVALCLYRVTQEGLNNAHRHGAATQVSVHAIGDENDVRLLITDDGRGFDMAQPPGTGIGLAGMQERVRHLGGRFQVTSRPGRGTRISVRIPLDGANSRVRGGA